MKNDEEIINLKLKLNSKTSDNNNNISSYRERKTRDKPLSKNESCFFCTLILVLKEDFHRTVKNAAHFLFIILCVFPCVALCVLIKKKYIEKEKKLRKDKKTTKKENQSEITKQTDKSASVKKTQRNGFQKGHKHTHTYILIPTHSKNTLHTFSLHFLFPMKFDSDDDTEEKICNTLTANAKRERKIKRTSIVICVLFTLNNTQ